MRISIVSRQGLAFLVLSLIAAVVLLLAGERLFALLALVVAGLIAYLYRDLPRRIPPKPHAVVSPLDGEILKVDHALDPYCEREAIHIEAKTHWYGPFVLRSPMDGKVLEQWLSPAGIGPDGRRNPPMMTLWIRSDDDEDLVLVVTPRSRRLRLSCQAHAGDRVGQGRRCGFIPLGARIEVFLPLNSRVQLKPGQKVSAGDSVLAQLIHK